MNYLPCNFSCLCGATPNGHMMKFFKIYPNWRKFSMVDPTTSYVQHNLLDVLTNLKRSNLKLAKRLSAERKVFVEKLEAKFENCCSTRFDEKNFGWVAENGNEILLTFWKNTWSPNSKSRRWTEVTATGYIYMPDKSEIPSAQELWDVEAEYDTFLKWLYSELFDGTILWKSQSLIRRKNNLLQGQF